MPIEINYFEAHTCFIHFSKGRSSSSLEAFELAVIQYPLKFEVQKYNEQNI